MHLISYIKTNTQLPETSIKNTVDLLNEDCTIPFISRYRKERTGNLDEVQIGEIVKYKELFETLEKRKIAILKAIEEQDALTDELKHKIEAAQDITTLEDLYLPFKKSRKTKADTARQNGLEPLAKIIMSQNANDVESIAFKYVKGEITSVDDALEGARHIIAEWINERTDIRNNIRHQLERFAMISTKVVKSKTDDENAQKFRDYFDWEESLSRIPSHRLLAILRAETEGYIKTKIAIDFLYSDDGHVICKRISEKYKITRLMVRGLADKMAGNFKDKGLEHQIKLDTEKLVERFLEQKKSNLFEYLIEYKFPKSIGIVSFEDRLSLFVEIAMEYQNQLDFKYRLQYHDYKNNEKQNKRLGYTLILPIKEKAKKEKIKN